MLLLKRGWPATVDEAVEELESLLPEESKEALKAIDNEWDLIGTCHFSFGGMVRGRFGLWHHENKALLRSCFREWMRQRREEAVTDLTPEKLDALRKRAAKECRVMLKCAGTDEEARRLWGQKLEGIATASPEELAEIVWQENIVGDWIPIHADTASSIIISALWRRLRGATQCSVLIQHVESDNAPGPSGSVPCASMSELGRVMERTPIDDH